MMNCPLVNVHVSSKISSLSSSTCISTSYHALHPAHNADELSLPEGDAELRSFFVRCTERREFQAATSERQQVHLCHMWGRNEMGGVSMQKLADFFQTGKSTIAFHLSKPFSPFEDCVSGKPGRPSLFSPEQLRELRDFITERFELRLPVTYEDIRDFAENHWDMIVNLSSLRSVIEQCEDFKTVIGEPLEDSRLFANPEQIDQYFRDIDEVITTGSIPAAFVINVDESGFDQFMDARRTTRIVPSTYDLDRVPVGVTRTEKRATLIGAISADGTAIRPMIILQRETVEKELLLRGYTMDKVHLARSDTGFVNSRLFLEWGKVSLIPHIRKMRAELSYDGPCLVIMDGFGCHQTTDFLELLDEENIIYRFIPPHTSDQLQPLDLGIFANQKRCQSNITVDSTLNRQTRQVIKMYDSYRMATTPKNTVGAFRRGGIVTWLDDTNLTLMVRVDRKYATAVRGNGHFEDVLDGDKERVRI